MGTRIFKLAMAVLLSASCAPQLFAQVVDTSTGKVHGSEENGVVVYRAIPFAQPPVGSLRWREPQPPKLWSGIRNAAFSPACPQKGAYPSDAPAESTSEDCLYLNIWKPVGAVDEKLPVMLWIYGGSLRNGSASIPIYSGDTLARRNVIVVTANYRLGVLGFLAHPELTMESSHGSSGNYGLLDQLAALRWIQREIAAFGGDPSNVTVFGHSSGGASVAALTASPLAHGLFHRAIGQSGGFFEPIELIGDFKLDGAEQAGMSFMSRANAASLEALRAKSVEDLLEISFRPNIIVDGYALPGTPYQIHRDNRHNKVPVLVGYTTDEGQHFLAGQTITIANFEETLSRHFPSFIVRLTAPDPGASDNAARRNAIAYEGDVRFGWSMWTWARLASRSAGGAWLYQFSQRTPFPADSPQAGWGAAHGSDLPYVFGHLDLQPWAWTDHDRTLSAAMITYWTNFAKNGNPNGNGVPEWPKFAETSPAAMQLGEEIKPALLKTDGTLTNLDRTYSAARWVVRNVYAVAIFAVLMVAALLWALVRFVRKRLRKWGHS